MSNQMYRDAGVDVEAGYEAVKLMKEHAARTLNSSVLGGLGSFGGFFSLEDHKMEKPVLVAGTDGVGTKLKYAFILDKHDTVGIDCVAMCVNDIICQGAKPLFFLDYLATGKLMPKKAADVVKGVSQGCVEAGCALIGGETAEMPGFYAEGEYDMAGFAVGIVNRDDAINGTRVAAGDVLVGLASSGLHSNGYSLVRKLMGEDAQKMARYSSELGHPLGQELLTPTRIYVKTIAAILAQADVHGIANITGGGFIENIPRMFGETLSAKIQLGSWPILPIFDMLQKAGSVPSDNMFNTFNMGIGMVLAVSASQVQAVTLAAKTQGVEAYAIGEIIAGQHEVVFA